VVQFDRAGRPFEILDRILAAFDRANLFPWVQEDS
jgi:hypothetical protein